MKNITIASLLFLGLSHSVFGQLYTTNFDGGLPTDLVPVPSTESDMTFKADNNGAGEQFVNFYTSAVPSDFDRVFLNYAGSTPLTPSNTQDFAVSLFTQNFAGTNFETAPGSGIFTPGLTSAVGALAQVGLNINNAADLSDGYNLYNGAYSLGNGFAGSDIIFSDGTNFTQPLNFASSATILAQFSAATQTFTFSYATDAVPSFSSFATLKIDGGPASSGTDFVQDWEMASGGLFDINIYAGSNVLIADQTTGLGFLNADTFTLDVVPEPSAYAAIVGLLALSAVMIRRRR